MGFPSDGTIAQVAVHWEGPGSHFARNITYWQLGILGTPDGWSSESLRSFLERWRDFEQGGDQGWHADVSEGWQLAELHGVAPAGTSLIDVTVPVGAEGTGSGDPSSPQVAILVHLRGVGPARHSHGRMYLPGPGEDGVDGAGNITAEQAEGYRSNIKAQWDNEDPDIEGATQVVYSKVADGSELDPPEYYTGSGNPLANTQLDISVDRKVATQRRRLRR